jgi:hypothetical protein
MKMSSLDALLDVLARLRGAGPGQGSASMSSFAPKRLTDPGVARRGGETIGRMRAFQKSGRLPDELVALLNAT